MDNSRGSGWSIPCARLVGLCAAASAINVGSALADGDLRESTPSTPGASPLSHVDPQSAWVGVQFLFPTDIVWTTLTKESRGVDRRSMTVRGRDAWGPVELVVAERNGFMSASLLDGHAVRWKARSTVGHPLVFERVPPPPPEVFLEGATDVLDRPTAPTLDTAGTPDSQQEEGGIAGGCVDADEITVLVVYTECSVFEAGGLGFLYSAVDLAEELTNLAMDNSLISTPEQPRHIRIVGIQPTVVGAPPSGSAECGFADCWDPQEPDDLCGDDVDFGDDLGIVSNVQSVVGGPVNQMRNYFKADLVVMLRVRGNAGGIAWRKSVTTGCDGTLGYCVVGVGGLYDITLAHELGHNFGCCHAPGDQGNYCPLLPWPYNNGHRFVGNDFVLYGTLMTYPPGANILYFSNPDVIYEGQPTGEAQDFLPYWSDNARTVRETFDDVRCYRCSNLPPASDPPAPSGPIVCWGNNSSGECSPPQGLPFCEQVAAGQSFTVAIGADHLVRAWGSNTYGQLIIPPALGACRSIAAGRGHVVVITGTATSGTVQAWGWNSSGQTDVPATLGACTSVAAGDQHSLALRSGTGTLIAWGSNTATQSTPPATLGSCLQAAGGYLHSVALKADGGVSCWGSNSAGQSTPTPGLPPCEQIAAGRNHTVALDATGVVWAWGSNGYGQCTIPASLGTARSIAAGGYHTLAIEDGGAGDDSVVAFGAGTTNTGTDPHHGQSMVPATFTGPIEISGGVYHTAIIATTADVTGCIGDFNNDGVRDGTDLTAVLSGWGTAAADCNGDRITDGLDLTFLLSGWGSCQ